MLKIEFPTDSGDECPDYPDDYPTRDESDLTGTYRDPDDDENTD